MTDWKETTLEEIAEITSAKRIFYSEYVTSGIPFYRSKEIIDKFNNRAIKTELFISKKRFNEIKNEFGAPAEGDILLTSVGTIGIPYLVKNNETFYFKDGNLTWFRKINENLIDRNFLYTWLKSKVGKSKLDEVTIGSTQAALTISGLKKIELLLPPLAVQKEISNVLTCIDEKIDLLHRQISTLESIAKSIFISWFEFFDFPDSNGNPYRTSNGKMQTTELGEIPDIWRFGNISNFIEILETGSRPKGGVGTFLNGIPSIGAENVKRIGVYDYEKTKYIPIEFFCKMNKGILSNRDILVYKDGGTPGSFIPHITIIGEGFPFKEMAINEHVFRVAANKSERQNYLYYWLNSDFVKGELAERGTGAAIPGINSTQLKETTLLIPDDETIRRFDKIIEPYVHKILKNAYLIQTLSKMHDIISPKLMSGEVKVETKKNE